MVVVSSRLLLFVMALRDGSLQASQVMLLFWIIDFFYLKTMTAEMWTCIMAPGFRSTEGTPTGGAQTPSAEQNATTPMGSATATASATEPADLPARGPVETAATPVAQGESAQQVATPVRPATAIPTFFSLVQFAAFNNIR